MHLIKVGFQKFIFILLLGMSFLTTNAQIVRIENNHINDTNQWSGNVDLNIYSVRNNSQFFKLASGSQVKYAKDKTTLLSINELRLIFAQEDELENRGFQHFRYQQNLDSTFTLEAFTQFQFDQVLKIKYRQLNGLGARMHLFRKSESKVFVGLHYMYEYEEEYETKIINRDHRLNSHFTFSKEWEKSFIHWVSYYQPNIQSFNDYRISGSATFSIELRKSLRFNIRGELVYDSKPVQGVRKITYTFLNGFSWEF